MVQFQRQTIPSSLLLIVCVDRPKKVELKGLSTQKEEGRHWYQSSIWPSAFMLIKGALPFKITHRRDPEAEFMKYNFVEVSVRRHESSQM
jgi:hypothetical protein